jgi:hypothetical protein
MLVYLLGDGVTTDIPIPFRLLIRKRIRMIFVLLKQAKF